MNEQDGGSPYGPFNGPAAIVVTGEAGLGKTTDDILTWPDAVYAQRPGGTKPAVKFLSRDLHPWQVQEVRDLAAIRDLVPKIAAENRGRQDRGEPLIPALVVDDLTITAKASYDAMKPQYSAKRTFAFWDAFKREVRITIEDVIACGLHLAANAHVGGPGEDMDGNFHKGGPEMPTLKLRRPVAHSFHDSWIAEARPGLQPFPAVYRVKNADPNWMTKSRHGYDGVYPLNMGELLRHRGYRIARLPGLEWQDTIAELFAQQLLDGADRFALWDKFYDNLLGKGLYDGHVYWALRDGLHRAQIRVQEQAGLRNRMTRQSVSGLGAPPQGNGNTPKPATTTQS